MAPSTVFSYWRRDHRRSSAPPTQQQQQQPTSASSKPGLTNNPPQLPVIPNTPDLTTSIEVSPGISDGSGSNTRPSEENPLPPPLQTPPHWDQNQADRLNVSSSRAPSSSATNLAVPSSSSEKQTRPHSSPEERSQSSFGASRPDNNGEGDSSSKPNSPFRLSFGKGTPSADSNKNSSATMTTTTTTTTTTATATTPGMAPPATSRSNNAKTSPDDSPADKPAVSQKDSKLERSNSRRNADRDGAAEHAHHKSGKAMLHLLNPMSLLARRRSSRVAGSKTDDMKIGVPNLVPAIPDDYDPRIRGNIVHDFSAPRPRRNLAATPSALQDQTSQPNAGDSPQNPQDTQNGSAPEPASQMSEQKTKQSEHSPAFKEHFEDDQEVLQVENKGYLQSPLLTNQSQHDGEHSLPVFARKLPSKIPEQEEEQYTEKQPEPETEPESEPQQQQQQQQQPPVLDSKSPSGSIKKEALPPVNEEEDTVVDMPQPPSGLPKHFKSNASRFSFDMTGIESSVQEKLLEEKHKEKEAARRSKYGSEDGEYSDTDDDFDNDLLDDMDDLEEKIPGVNVDADEDDLDGFSGSGNMMMNRSWFSPGLSPIIGSPASPAGPSPNMAGLSTTQGAPGPAEIIQNSHSPSLYETATPENNANGSQEIDAKENTTEPAPVPLDANPGVSQPVDDDDDDLYFDDGEFGDLSADVGGDDGQKFDESIFDDETSHLYERKKKQAVPPGPVASEEPTATNIDDVSSEDEELTENLTNRTEGLKHAPSMVSEYRGPGLKAYGSLSEGAPNLASAKAHGGVLSEHNLEALHNALTKAAAGNDQFEQTESVSDRSLGQESAAQTADPHPGLISDNSRLSQAMDVFGSEEVFEDLDYDDTDSALYDDPIIAAANAEALENDDEGIYGEEFGFYAHAHGYSGAQLTNGGYFGPRRVEALTRSFSSRGKFREPSLTPITERSERSTRNSVISLTAAHGGPNHSNQPVSSPGLAQLVDLGNLDDEMSFSALMKLRRGAWGGSNGSLRSSSASPPPAPYSHSASNRGSFTALSDASPTVQAMPADLIWPGSGSATESPIRDPERNGSSTASPV